MINRKQLFSFIVMLSTVLISACSQADQTPESQQNPSAEIQQASSTQEVTQEGNCLEVSLTGTMGGPAIFNGLAGSGTLVKFGSVANNCGDVMLQFDAGRGTAIRLSELGVPVNKLDAVFITHLHSDHTVGLVDIMQTRWHFFGKPLDLVCSADKTAQKPAPRTLSCDNFGQHIADAAMEAGEIAQRSIESNKRDSAGPSAMVNFISVESGADNTPTEVWSSGEVSVLAVASQHIPGHLSYRVNTPQGSVVIGGDAGNNVPSPPRPNSTSAAVEALAKDADVLVHSTMHPVFGPDGGSNFPPKIFFRQSTAGDLGALSKRANVANLMLTHLIPAIGAKSVGPYQVPGGPLTAADYEKAVAESDYQGAVHVGTDKLTLRLPAN